MAQICSFLFLSAHNVIQLMSHLLAFVQEQQSDYDIVQLVKFKIALAVKYLQVHTTLPSIINLF